MNELPPFEELLKIDENQLEDLRLKYVNNIIDSARDENHKRKLKGLQFKIDMIRRKHKTPMGACIEISKMMHDSFLELRDVLKEAQNNNIAQLLGKNKLYSEEPKEEKQETTSKILEFKRDDK